MDYNNLKETSEFLTWASGKIKLDNQRNSARNWTI